MMRFIFISLIFTTTFAFAAESTPPPSRTSDAPVAFKKFLNSVTENHPKLTSAKMTALSQKSTALSKKMQWTPSLSAQMGKSSDNWDSGAEFAKLSANLNLFRFGGDAAAVKEGYKLERQAENSYLLSKIELQNQASLVLFRWIQLSNQIESQKSLVSGKKELVRVARERFAKGQLPSQEVAKVRLDANNADIEIQQAEVQLLEVKSQLDSYLAGATSILDWPWQKLANSPVLKTQKAVQERLKYENLKLESEIKGHREWSSKTGFLPSLDFTSVWENNYFDRFEDGQWTSFIALTIPLWDRGENYSASNYWHHQRQAAEADLKNYKLEEETKLATLSERKEKLRLVLLQSLQSAEQSNAIAKESLRRFQLGRATVNDLLLDQSRVYSAEILAQQTLFEFHSVLLEMCLAADELPADCY